MQTPSIPDHLVPLFDSWYEGQPATFISSVDACRALERELAERGISYRTKIIKSRRRGLLYCTYLVYPHGS